MSQFHFRDDPKTLHTAQRAGEAMRVDGRDIAVRTVAPHAYVATAGARSVRVHAVAHGDTVHLHLNGRAWRIDRVDPARGAAGGAAGAAGDSVAPMPGVVIKHVASLGAAVHEGDALLVIESMKLQMTITAGRDGVVETLPFAAGQTFQRGAVLAHVGTGEGRA
jgi:biotin carboxyl carrier protein